MPGELELLEREIRLYEALLEQQDNLRDPDDLFRIVHDLGKQASYLDRKHKGYEMHVKNAEYFEEPAVALHVKSVHASLRNRLWDLVAKFFVKTKLWNEWARYVKGFGDRTPSENLLKIWAFLNPEKAKHISNVWSYAGLTKAKLRERRDRVGYLKNAAENLALACAGMRPGLFNLNEPRPRRNFVLGGYGRLLLQEYRRAKEKYPDWTPAHRFMHAVVVTAKWILADNYRVWWYIYRGRLVKTYAVEKGIEDYMYMPPIDKARVPPAWWLKMKEDMIAEGIRPIEL